VDWLLKAMAGELIRTQNTNYRSEVVELGTKLESCEETSQLALHVFLQVNSEEFEEDVGLIKVSFRRLRLSVKPSGLSVDPETRYGSKIIPEMISSTRDEEVVRSNSLDTTATISSKAEVSLEKPAMKLGLESTGSARMASTGSQTIRQTSTRDHFPVRSLTGNAWDISMPDNAPLEGTFLSGVQLCVLSANQGANRQVVETVVEAKQRDMDISLDPSGIMGRLRETFPGKAVGLSNTKEKLIKIAFAKSFSALQGDYKGVVVISKSVISDE